jgi:hypothetical protein
MELPANKVFREIPVRLAQQVRKAQRALMGKPGQQELRVLRARPALLGQQDYKGLPVPMALRAQLVLD